MGLLKLLGLETDLNLTEGQMTSAIPYQVGNIKDFEFNKKGRSPIFRRGAERGFKGFSKDSKDNESEHYYFSDGRIKETIVYEGDRITGMPKLKITYSAKGKIIKRERL